MASNKKPTGFYTDYNREIKGYVEAIYKLEDINPYINLSYKDQDVDVNIENKDGTCLITNLYNTERKSKKYTILYENFIKLSDNYYLFNKNENADIFVSEKKLSEINSDYVTLSIANNENLLQKNISGITIYCGMNPIIKYTYKLINSDNEVIEEFTKNNIDSNFFVTFENDTTNCRIEIDFEKFLYEDRHIILEHIDYGITYIYENSNLINFTVTEQVNKLMSEVPANELTFTIGDYEKIFNPLNPTGIVKYITNETQFIPYVGILSGNGEIWYTKLGIFYYNNISYQDKTITFTSYNLIKKLFETNIRPFQCRRNSGSSLIEYYTMQKNELSDNLNLYLSENYKEIGSYIDINNSNIYNLSNIENNNLGSLLQNLAMIDGIFYVSRWESIYIKKINKTSYYMLTKNRLLSDAKYEILPNKKNAIYTTQKYTSASSKQKNYNFSVNLTGTITYTIISLDDLTGMQANNSSITFTGADNVLIDGYTTTNTFTNFIFLKIFGKKGNTANITLNYYAWTSEGKVTNEKNYLGTESNIKIYNPIMSGFDIDYNLDNFIDKIPTFSISCEYIGDANISAGDYITVETDYGYKDIFVQKHTLTYDGGLKGTIEGVE